MSNPIVPAAHMVDKFGKVAVLMGGPSAEREVSLKSGAAVLAGLQRQGVDAVGIDADESTVAHLQAEKFDRAFIVLHGRWGEDGVIQGALEAIGMPYTGCGLATSSIGMNKVVTKQLWQAHKLPTAKFKVIAAADDLLGLEDELGLPMFIKPAHEGSSVGVSKVSSVEDIQAAWKLAASQDSLVLAEQFIDGPELTIAILDDVALPVIRLQAANDFYDYQAKYESDETQYHCPAGLSEDQEQAIRALALQAFRVLGGESWGRVDIMLDRNERPYLLEVNTVPGMTDHSLVPMAAKNAGLSFDELVVRILELSL
ncbi:MAG: D-alanine--D-alanine ligase [Arenicella sp.]